MLGRKWNIKTKLYEPYDMPDKAKLYSINMDEIVECARCAKEIKFGDGYTSKQIHTGAGLGYTVCENCHEEEYEEEKEARLNEWRIKKSIK